MGTEDPVFSFGGKTYNANHLNDKQIGEFVMGGCQIFKKEDDTAEISSTTVTKGK